MRKSVSAFVMLLILSVVFASFPQIGVVKAEGTIYIRADGTVEGTDKIQIDGDVYTFISDINGSIRVERDNVVLNGAGYRLQGDGNQNGITLRFGNNITVKNLQLSSFHIGIVVMGSDNNKILENTITNNFRGLDFTSSENDTVSGNYIANNVGGIALENMYNNIVENTITNNSNFGIHLYGAGFNNMIGNNITNNKRGIVVSTCYDNVIYHNNFVNNTNHVETDDSNGIWDNGEEGNYWDDYTGVDNDGDGIGDTSYILNENNQDNYPLTNVIPEFPSLIMSLDEAIQAVTKEIVGEWLSTREVIGELSGEPYVHDSGITAYLLWLATNGTLYQAEYPSGKILGQYLQTYIFDGNISDSSYIWDLNYGHAETYWIEATNGTILHSTPYKVPLDLDEPPFEWSIQSIISIAIVITAVIGSTLIYFRKSRKTVNKAE